MTAAFDERSERQKQAAILRSLADQVSSPVVAGRRSRRALSDRQKTDWNQIASNVVNTPLGGITDAEILALAWKANCRAVGIGTGLLGWFLWNWAFPLLLELAQRWIESQRSTESRDSDR